MLSKRERKGFGEKEEEDREKGKTFEGEKGESWRAVIHGVAKSRT